MNLVERETKEKDKEDIERIKLENYTESQLRGLKKPIENDFNYSSSFRKDEKIYSLFFYSSHYIRFGILIKGFEDYFSINLYIL